MTRKGKDDKQCSSVARCTKQRATAVAQLKEAFLLSTTVLPRLHRGAFHSSITTIYAAVSRLGLEHLFAAFALIKILASSRRHHFVFLMSTYGTSNRGLQHSAHVVSFVNIVSRTYTKARPMYSHKKTLPD